MKRKLSLLLAVVMSVTMIMGLSITSLADYDFPEQAECGVPGHEGEYHAYVLSTYMGTGEHDGVLSANVALYDETGAKVYTATEDGEWCPMEYFNEGLGWYLAGEGYFKCHASAPASCAPSAPAHIHNFVWGTIIEPTMDHDGLEGEVCSCGATKNTQLISAYAYAMEQYAYNKVANTGAGNTCVLEMGTMDSYPKRFMEAIAPSVLRGVTVELRFKSNQKLTKIQIPGGSVVDTSFDWYGVNKLKELYTVIQ